jgi:uncharacterized protein (DUF1684 family)
MCHAGRGEATGSPRRPWAGYRAAVELADALDLLDWKRRVFALYEQVRAEPDPQIAWQRWRDTRDDLLAHHPQTALTTADRASFTGLEYFDYDPSARVIATVEPLPAESRDLPSSGPAPILFARIGTARFTLGRAERELELFWLTGYGGGLFLPFRDGTSGEETYGGGRYLLDTVKGADLGALGDSLVLDFNFSYHPSCSYQPSWVCPLAPAANTLDVPVRAGERTRR